MLLIQPTIEDREVLRFTQLRLAAKAYDAERVIDIAKRAYRNAREAASVVQLKMRVGDYADAQLMLKRTQVRRVSMCAFGCGLAAAKGDVYCADCRSHTG